MYFFLNTILLLNTLDKDLVMSTYQAENSNNNNVRMKIIVI